MCFCSIEHQKLVSTSQSYLDRLLTSSRQIWPVHKLVCGRHGNPFRWPGFTQAEAEEIISLRHERELQGSRQSFLELYKDAMQKHVGARRANWEELFAVRPQLVICSSSRYPELTRNIILSDSGLDPLYASK